MNFYHLVIYYHWQ